MKKKLKETRVITPKAEVNQDEAALRGYYSEIDKEIKELEETQPKTEDHAAE